MRGAISPICLDTAPVRLDEMASVVQRESPWPSLPLEHVVDVLDARRIPVNKKDRQRRAGTIPYYGATGQVGWIDEAIFDEELVLLGEDGAPFLNPDRPKAYVIDGPAWVNNHAHVLRVNKPRLLSRFLMHYLNFVDYRSHVAGTTRLKLTQAAMKQIPVPTPSPQEQERIVEAIEEHFSRLDTAEAELKSALERLEDLRRSILHQAFNNPTWPQTTLGEVFEIVGGATPRTSIKEYWGGDIPWVTPDDLSRHDGITISCGRRSLTRAGLEASSTRLLPTDTVLFSSRAPIGYVAIASNPICTNQGFKSLRPSKHVRPRFTYWYLHYMTPRIREMGSGTTFREISRKRMSKVPMILPPLREQDKVVQRIEMQLDQLLALQRTIGRSGGQLDTLRRAVLASAFSGTLV